MDRIARSLAAGPFPLKRLLVLTDLSAAADNAAWRAGLIAAEHGAWMHLLHTPRWPGHAGASQRRLEATAWHLQERLNIPVLAQSVPPRRGCELEAAAGQADLVVVPAAGRCSSLNPRRIVRRFERPTLAVRRPATVPYQRVLACIHDAGTAASCIATASGMAGGPHVDLIRHGLADEALLAGMGSRDELEADSLARYVQGRIHDLARALGATRMKEAPTLAFTASADALLDQEYALLPELVVSPHLPSLARALPAHTMADTLWLPRAVRDAAALGQAQVPCDPTPSSMFAQARKEA